MLAAGRSCLSYVLHQPLRFVVTIVGMRLSYLSILVGEQLCSHQHRRGEDLDVLGLDFFLLLIFVIRSVCFFVLGSLSVRASLDKSCKARCRLPSGDRILDSVEQGAITRFFIELFSAASRQALPFQVGPGGKSP